MIYDGESKTFDKAHADFVSYTHPPLTRSPFPQGKA